MAKKYPTPHHGGMDFEPDDEMKKEALQNLMNLYKPSPERKNEADECMPGETPAECASRKKQKRGM